jgi:hypothetical protein
VHLTVFVAGKPDSKIILFTDVAAMLTHSLYFFSSYIPIYLHTIYKHIKKHSAIFLGPKYKSAGLHDGNIIFQL